MTDNLANLDDKWGDLECQGNDNRKPVVTIARAIGLQVSDTA